MPMYEYLCKECDHAFEMLVQGEEHVECPECRSAQVEKMLSVPAAPRVSGTTALSRNCDPQLPPCGPGCCRL